MTSLSAIEQAARDAWVLWGSNGYAKFTPCDACDEFLWCRSPHGRRFICLDCFDQGVR